MEVIVKLLPNQKVLNDPDKYQRLVGKMNYLTRTKHVIAFVVSVMSQFLSAARTTHWEAIVQIHRHLKKARVKWFLFRIVNLPELLVSQMLIRQSYPLTGELPQAFTFSLKKILYHGKVRSVVSRSSTESNYRVMVNVTYELV